MSIHNPIVVGKYDKVEAVFATRPQRNDTHTFLALHPEKGVKSEYNGTADDLEIADVRLPIKIGASSRIVPISLIIGGIVLQPLISFINSTFSLNLTELYLSLTGAMGLIAVAGGVALLGKLL